MAIYTILNQKQIASLLSQFPSLPKLPFAFKGIAMGTVNTYYRITFKDQSVYYLKIDEVGNEKRLQNELAIFHFLKSQSQKLSFAFPYPTQAKNEKFYLKFGKKYVLIFPEVAGQIIFEDKLKSSHLKTIGKYLAQLHSLQVAKKIKLHRFCLSGQKQVYQLIEKKLAKQHPELVSFIKGKLLELIKLEPKKEKLVLIHADLFAENIHWIKNNLNGILDFEAAGLGSPFFDICVCFHALCHNGKGFDLKKIKAFLSGYESEIPLKASVKKNFSYYLNQSSMRFLLTRLKDFELVDGEVKAEPFKDYRDFIRRFEDNEKLKSLFS